MKFAVKMTVLTAILAVLIAMTITLVLSAPLIIKEKDYSKGQAVLNLTEEKKYSDYTWNHVPIKYEFDNSCSSRKSRIDYAIEEIERLTDGSVSFVNVKENGDIKFTCENFPRKENDEEILGRATVEYSKNSKKIISAKISLFGLSDKKCYYPDVEMHEILHSLGQGHNNIDGSIMRTIQNDCLKEIESDTDYKIFEHIKNIY